MSDYAYLRSSDYKVIAELTRALSTALDVEHFRVLLVSHLDQAFPAAIFTLNAVGQPEGTIYCVREGREVHDTYASELPGLWPAQEILLEVPPPTAQLFATTLSRSAPPQGSEQEQGCVEFYRHLQVDDAAALLLQFEHEYFGLVCVNTLGLVEKQKSRLENFLEYIGPIVSATYAAVCRRPVVAELCKVTAQLQEHYGYAAAVIDDRGMLHGASDQVVSFFEKLSYTNRKELGGALERWIASAKTTRSGFPQGVLAQKTEQGPLRCRYRRRISQGVDGYAWHIVDFYIPSNARAATPLTSAELKVVGCIARGASDREASDELNISLHTVRRHVSNALRKLGLSSRMGLAAWFSAFLDQADKGVPARVEP